MACDILGLLAFFDICLFNCVTLRIYSLSLLSAIIAAKIPPEEDLLLLVGRTAEAVDFFLMGAVDQLLVVGLPIVVFVCFLLLLALFVAFGTVAFLLACTLAANASSSSNHPRLDFYVPKQRN